MDNATEFIDLSRRLRSVLTPADLDETLTGSPPLPSRCYRRFSAPASPSSTLTGDWRRPRPPTTFCASSTPPSTTCARARATRCHRHRARRRPDLAADPRWPRYAPVALAAGVHAQAGIRLFDAEKSNGALNLYAEKAGAFEDLTSLGALFTHHAGLAIDYARQIDQLKEAVETRQLIGQAVGMVMQQYDLDDARAFAFLTRLSSTTNTKLKTVAERVVEEHNTRTRAD